MKSVVIVYYSGSGHTALVAESVARGAQAVPNTKVELVRIAGEQIKEGRWKDESSLAKLAGADAIVFGTPTYMGGPAAQFKAFADATGEVWYKRGWSGKLAAGFTSSGSPSGDKLSTLQYLNLFANQHGMLWTSQPEVNSAYFGRSDGVNRLGSHTGVMAQNSGAPGQPAVLDSGDAATAEVLGRHVATIAAKL
ncbi:p-benzoquinone reductase [mine drainage metagenome]|uniref:p-benzoquinone reductase n=1 Tax=mine drainage metagenome TaxID=410659 RepID=A0A1J5RUK0_9ZZZZ